MPSARLPVILSIRCWPPEQGRLVPRAAMAAGQLMAAAGCPLPGLRWMVMNWLVKSPRFPTVDQAEGGAVAPALHWMLA